MSPPRARRACPFHSFISRCCNAPSRALRGRLGAPVLRSRESSSHCVYGLSLPVPRSHIASTLFNHLLWRRPERDTKAHLPRSTPRSLIPAPSVSYLRHALLFLQILVSDRARSQSYPHLNQQEGPSTHPRRSSAAAQFPAAHILRHSSLLLYAVDTHRAGHPDSMRDPPHDLEAALLFLPRPNARHHAGANPGPTRTTSTRRRPSPAHVTLCNTLTTRPRSFLIARAARIASPRATSVFAPRVRLCPYPRRHTHTNVRAPALYRPRCVYHLSARRDCVSSSARSQLLSAPGIRQAASPERVAAPHRPRRLHRLPTPSCTPILGLPRTANVADRCSTTSPAAHLSTTHTIARKPSTPAPAASAAMTQLRTGSGRMEMDGTQATRTTSFYQYPTSALGISVRTTTNLCREQAPNKLPPGFHIAPKPGLRSPPLRPAAAPAPSKLSRLLRLVLQQDREAARLLLGTSTMPGAVNASWLSSQVTVSPPAAVVVCCVGRLPRSPPTRSRRVLDTHSRLRHLHVYTPVLGIRLSSTLTRAVPVLGLLDLAHGGMVELYNLEPAAHSLTHRVAHAPCALAPASAPKYPLHGVSLPALSLHPVDKLCARSPKRGQ
ncbi:hypothetical protein B0H19DRAFT_1252297 [Mycena capillaripes]|nr:hypothetical protein B0H19DRAFT_1252297 [Mycena capillaripes]